MISNQDASARVRAALAELLQHVGLSYESAVSDLVWRSPAEDARKRAADIDRRDAAIIAARAALAETANTAPVGGGWRLDGSAVTLPAWCAADILAYCEATREGREVALVPIGSINWLRPKLPGAPPAPGDEG